MLRRYIEGLECSRQAKRKDY